MPVTQDIGRITYTQPTSNSLSSSSINFSATGDNTLVAAVSGQTVRVFYLFLVVSASTNLIFKDGAATNLTGAINMTGNGSIMLDFNGQPWFVTTSGNAFILNQSGTAQVSGRIFYEQS